MTPLPPPPIRWNVMSTEATTNISRFKQPNDFSMGLSVECPTRNGQISLHPRSCGFFLHCFGRTDIMSIRSAHILYRLSEKKCFFTAHTSSEDAFGLAHLIAQIPASSRCHRVLNDDKSVPSSAPTSVKTRRRRIVCHFFSFPPPAIAPFHLEEGREATMDSSRLRRSRRRPRKNTRALAREKESNVAVVAAPRLHGECASHAASMLLDAPDMHQHEALRKKSCNVQSQLWTPTKGVVTRAHLTSRYRLLTYERVC